MSRSSVPNGRNIKIEILVPGDEEVSVGGLSRWLNRNSPKAIVHLRRDIEVLSIASSVEQASGVDVRGEPEVISIVSSLEEESTTGYSVGSTPSEREYLRRARGFLGSQASVGSQTSVEFSEEPDGETLGSVDSTRSVDSNSEDLSFISHTESVRDILPVKRFLEQNNEQDTKRLKRVPTVKRGLDELEEYPRDVKRSRY